MTSYLIPTSLILAAAALLAAFVWVLLRFGGEPEHEGADVEYADELHNLPTRLADMPTVIIPAYAGRHHEDTVEIVLPDYMPAVGARRIAALTDDTQRIEAVR